MTERDALLERVETDFFNEILIKYLLRYITHIQLARVFSQRNSAFLNSIFGNYYQMDFKDTGTAILIRGKL